MRGINKEKKQAQSIDQKSEIITTVPNQMNDSKQNNIEPNGTKIRRLGTQF